MKDWKDPSSLGFILSLVLHGILLALAVWGLFIQPPSLDVEPIIPVDIMTLGPQTRAPRPKPVASRDTPKAPAKKTPPPRKTEPEKKPVLETWEKPTTQPEAIPLPEKKPTPKPEKKKEFSEKKKEAPKPPVKKPPEKPKKRPLPKSDDSLDSLFDEVENEQNDISPLDSLLETDPESRSIAVAPAVGSLTISEQDFIKRQIQKFWTPPPGTKGSDVVITVTFTLTKEGLVQDVMIVGNRGTPAHPLYKVTAESITRALRDPQFTLPLPQEKYGEWKTLTLNVSPKDFESIHLKIDIKVS